MLSHESLKLRAYTSVRSEEINAIVQYKSHQIGILYGGPILCPGLLLCVLENVTAVHEV